MLVTCWFHFKLLLIVKPKIRAWVTTSSELLFNVTFGREGFFDLLREKRNSLHLEGLNCSLFAVDQTWTLSTASCMEVTLSLWTISDIEVSSMYF